MRDKSILESLKTECTFLEVFQNLERAEGSICEYPRKKIGHIRADYNDCRWWNTWWPCHVELADEAAREELTRTYEDLVADDALKDLGTLVRFCESHPETCSDPQFRQEYNFFLEGERCNYWIRLITRFRDYNIYLNAYAR